MKSIYQIPPNLEFASPEQNTNKKTKINKKHNNTIMSNKSNQVQHLKDQIVLYPKQHIKHYISLEFQPDKWFTMPWFLSVCASYSHLINCLEVIYAIE